MSKSDGRRITSLIVVLILMMSLLPANVAFASTTIQVDHNLQKEDIMAMAKAYPHSGFDTWEITQNDEEPNLSPPYSAGSVAPKDMEDAKNALAMVRYLAGVPYENIVFREDLNSLSQHAAVFMAVTGQFTHSPVQDSRFSADFFGLAKRGMSEANIIMGTTNASSAILSFMTDPGDINIGVLGHRRWALKPYSQNFGLGFAISDAGRMSLHVLDGGNSLRTSEADSYIAWPNSGDFPLQYFHGSSHIGQINPYSWSVNLGAAYMSPDKSTAKVKLTRESDSKTWTFDNSTANLSGNDTGGNHFSVDNKGYGISKAIIFRPNVQELGVVKDGEAFLVEVSGIKTKGGVNTELKYRVTFFDMEAAMEVQPSSVKLDKTQITMALGTTDKLTATVMPENATDKSLIWSSSDPTVVKVDSQGKLSPVKEGTATISVETKKGGRVASSSVRVTAGAKVTGLRLSPKNIELIEGETGQITGIISPENALNKRIIWTSSDNSVVWVNSVSGELTALRQGTATISASTEDGGFKDTATVKVKRDVTKVGVFLNKSSLSLSPGSSEYLLATVKLDTKPDLVWSSSNTNVATVDNNGMVRALSLGSATVTVKTKDNAYSATSQVTVQKEKSVTGISLNQGNQSLKVGETVQLTAEVTPVDAIDQAVVWQSSNINVATISPSGLLQAVGYGQSVITAISSDGGFRASLNLTVSAAKAVTGVRLDPEILSLRQGQIGQLHATVLPEDAGNKKISFISDNTSVVTVDNDGRLLAAGQGTARVTVTTEQGGFKDTVLITVSEGKPVSGLRLDRSNATLDKGDSFVIQPTVLPEDAENKNLSLKSGVPAVATVDSTGRVTAVEEGSTVITVTTQDGGYTATVLVVVKQDTGATPFKDIQNHWARKEIEWVYERGLFNGITADTFAPQAYMTRAMLATVLYRFAGSPEVSGDLIFSDVRGDVYYSQAVIWAADLGVINGVGEGRFEPHSNVTREQMVAMLYRYAKSQGETEGFSSIDAFKDSELVESWAREAMEWAVGNEIIIGTGDYINPQGKSTRAEVATVLKRYCKCLG